MKKKIAVYLEEGTKRTFASAVDWPGWSRGARDDEGALELLATYGPRYAAVVKNAAPAFVAPGDASTFEVVKRLKGNTGTDFGVPTLGLATDSKPVGPAELSLLIDVLQACWAAFERAARAARGIELRKGPRGGGRDLDKIREHVIEAEEAYLVQLGAKRPKHATKDPAIRGTAVRKAILDTLEARARGRPVAEASQVKTPWTPRYFARRAAWHVLDHAWEIEDRASPTG